MWVVSNCSWRGGTYWAWLISHDVRGEELSWLNLQRSANPTNDGWVQLRGVTLSVAWCRAKGYASHLAGIGNVIGHCHWQA